MRRGAKPSRAKVKARRPAARKPLKNEGAKVRDLEKRLAESLEQQTATAEILRVIGTSPMDTQPVFDVIARSGVRVCGAHSCALFVVDGDMLRVAATHGVPVERVERFRTQFPMPLSAENHVTQVLHERRIFHLADIEHNPAATPEDIENARVGRYRARLMVPMLRGNSALGLIAVTAQAPTPFSDQQVALLQTFAAQAVIAIENVRLFAELQQKNEALTQAHARVSESLEQQTATSEILRVISSSPTDIQPVFDTIVRSAVRLCDGLYGTAVRFDGEMMHLAADHNYTPEVRQALQEAFPMRPNRRMMAGRAILTRTVIQIEDALDDPEYAQHVARAGGFRGMLAVPMMREGNPIGAIVVNRGQPGPFSVGQIELLQTFADQAVIAVENARLFKELEARNRDLTEALEQQTATSEILRVMSRSQTDVQPVFDTIVRSAVSLCDGLFSALFQVDGELIDQVAQHNFSPEALEELRRLIPARPSRAFGAGRAILEGAVVHIPDVELDPEYQHHTMSSAVGWRSGLFVPMLREGAPIGAIAVMRAEPGPFSDNEIALLQTFADQAVIAVENVRLFKELEARNREVTEALDQKTATSEILGVISSSPTDIRPVFDAIMRSAVRLSGARFGGIYRFDGEMVHFVGQHGSDPDALETYQRMFPMRPDRGLLGPRSILDRAVVHVPDVFQDPEYVGKDLARASGWRSSIAVPMLREGIANGTIVISKAEPGPFSHGQIELLKTFADQAVIAIENVRLFTELREKNEALTVAHAQVSETLEQQTATAEILRVISSSPTDVQPVFDVIVARAVHLCGAEFGRVYRFDGGVIHMVAGYGISLVGLGELQRIFPRAASDDTIVGRVILGRQPAFVRDIEREEGVPALSRRMIQALGTRSQVTIPMLRAGEPIGAVTLGWAEPEAFDEQQIALVKTFADQAVIAIENVRLFTELGARNRDLTEALEQQTATSEILRVISQSPTDVQPVFDTIAKNARRLCDADSGGVVRLDGGLLHLEALDNATAEGAEAMRRSYPNPVSQGTASGRAILTGRPVHIPDVLEEPGFEFTGLQGAGLRSVLCVPMLRHGAAIGVVAVHSWGRPRPFTDNQMELLKTFADQAVIAIENVRLFKELQARTNELTRSVDQLTALGEISQAVSSTLDVETVLQTIVSRASQLAGADGCAIYEYDHATEAFHIRATHNLDAGLVATLRAAPLRKGEGAMGRAAETREATQIADIAAPGAYQSHIRDTLLAAGYRALLSVPLLREGEVIGSLSLNRHAPGEFPPEAVEVLKTFATQSALAMQNARLFREIADKSRQLEVASQHKSEFLANMSHELRTPLNAIIGFSEVLNERMFGELNDKQAEYLKDIHGSGTHLLSLINDILDLSKVEAGRMELELSDFDLPAAIDSALTLVRERATRRGIALGTVIQDGIGGMTGDERKIRQVLLNLLSNAIKFTPEGGRIEVGAVPNDGSVEVSVRDTGVGIAPEDHEAVFEEFRQVGAADKKAEGTGLGLALARKFIELHGGKIWVKSQVGAGSTFTFTLPFQRSSGA